MIPDFKIDVLLKNSYAAAQTNATERIRDRLLSLRITDSVDQRSDFLELVLDDRDHKLATPKDGTRFYVKLGYQEDSDLTNRGTFYYDETEFDLTNRRLSIRARATNFSGDFKEPKHRSFDGQLLGEILTTIAQENNFQYDIPDDLFLNDVPHLDQNNESDLNLVNRLRNEYDAVFKIMDNTLFFLPSGSGDRITLTPADVTAGRMTMNDRAKWGDVAVQHYDVAAAEGKLVQTGDAEPLLRLAKPRGTEAEAEAVAKATKTRQQRAQGALSLSLPGRGDLTANGVIVMQDWRDGINGEWLVNRVEHVLDSGGYRCQVEAEILKWY